AALDGARRLDPAGDRDAALDEPGGDDLGLVGPVRLARAERDRAVRRDQERVEDVAEVGVRRGLEVQVVDPDAEAIQRLDEAVVLALGGAEIDRPKEAAGRVVEGTG